MLKSLTISCMVILNLLLDNVLSGTINNEVLLLDNGYNLTEYDVLSTKTSPYVEHDVGETGGKEKVVNIVVNPIIHNVAQSYGGGQNEKPPATSTASPVTITAPPVPLLIDIIRVFFRKTRFLTRFMLNSARALVRAAIRFIICTFVPICGIFGVFSDEGDFESIASPEGVARGLGFVEGLIEQYHSLQNSTML